MNLQERLAGLQKGGAGTSGQQGDNDAGGGGAKAEEAEKTRLRQRIAELEADAQDALPYVNALEGLARTTVGKQIIERLQAGEDLTEYQLAKLEKEAKKEGSEAERVPITMEELKAQLAESEKRTAEKVGETIRANEGAREANDRLEKWATEKFPGYMKIRGSKVWNGVMAGVLASVQNGAIKVEWGVDPWEVIIQRTYHTIVSEDPDIIKGEVPSTSKLEERLSTILATGSKAGAPEEKGEDEELANIKGGYYKRLLDFAKQRSSGAIGGLSYANRGANKQKD